MGYLKIWAVVFSLFVANAASAQASVNDLLFRNIAQENYDSQKGVSTYGLLGVGSTCEIWISGQPGSFRVISYLANVPKYGGPVPGVRYYFEEATLIEGALNWISQNGKNIELKFDPVNFKVVYFNDENVGCKAVGLPATIRPFK